MKFCRIVCGILLALAIGGIAPASAGSPPPIGVLRSDAPSRSVVADAATTATPDASKTAADRNRWTAKDVIIVVAAVGFVLLLAVGAVVVKRRGES